MGEINTHDEFGSEIIKTVEKYNLNTILEIGSWDGTGSTSCFIHALKKLPGEKKLTCLEVNTDRYNQLVDNTKQYDWVECHNNTSISYDQLLEKDFNNIWHSNYNGILINPAPPTKIQAEGWFNEDVENIKKFNTSFLMDDTAFYEGVLIDGGEFFGYSEYKILKDRTNVLFLDDYFYANKTNRAARELLQDEEWVAIAGNRNVRNGYAIFKRRIFINKL